MISGQSHLRTRNRKYRRAAAKPTACAKPLTLSTGTSDRRTDGRTELRLPRPR